HGGPCTEPRLHRHGEQPHPYGGYAHPVLHGYGYETAAQRYSATRIQAGYEPERSVSHSLSNLRTLQHHKLLCADVIYEAV
uniref:Uncharacterized protein n=1 Tax=Pundamilia nyererei TaxID=303518 RepID=A0A3B4G9W6_9CICH